MRGIMYIEKGQYIMKVLIIDDNQMLAESIKSHLSKHFIVDVAHTGHDGIEKAASMNYAVIILDLGLPDIGGDEVCKKLRAQKVTTPILILTVTQEIQSRVALLDAGADDFLTKPFNGSELRARVSALSRRNQPAHSHIVLTVDDLSVNLASRTVTKGDKEIILRRKEFDILAYLMKNKGRAVTRAMILDHAWDSKKDNWNNTVDVHIKYLRDKIDKPFGINLIKTAYGIGYIIDDK